jgi:O-antigen/teichoic acid export membrane protein
MTLGMALREFASPEFLIQRQEVTRADIRTAFTVLLVLYGPIAAVLVILAPWLASSYGVPELSRYIYVVAAAGLLDTLSLPILALLRRDMAFGLIAIINTAVAVAGAAVTITLAVFGFGFMSFAWAWLVSAMATPVLALWFRPYWWMFVPTFASWRSVLDFGSCNGAAAALGRFYEALPQLVLGRMLSAEVAAFYNRSVMVVALPDRIILGGIFSVAFPAFATEVRRGTDMKRAYLLVLSHITVFHWPALLLLAMLAHPVVMVLMGQQWIGIVPLVQLISIASLFWFPVILTQPVLVALGAQRDNLVAKLVSVLVCGAVLCGASFLGIEAMVASQFIALPFQMFVSLVAVRRHVAFGWGEVFGAVWRSAAVTALSLFGPLAVVFLTGSVLRPSVAEAVLAGALVPLGWVGGLWLTRHPFFWEFSSLVRKGWHFETVRKLFRAVRHRAGLVRRAPVS